MTNTQGRGPETPAQALEDMDREARERPRRMPAWRRRALYPVSEGVAPRFGNGKDMTGHTQGR